MAARAVGDEDLLTARHRTLAKVVIEVAHQIRLYPWERVKRMLERGATPEHLAAVELGVASHNLFDLAYTLVLAHERKVQGLVGIDAVVTDKSGNPVTGLGPDDFELFENRKRQTISNFSEYRETEVTRASEAPSATTPSTCCALGGLPARPGRPAMNTTCHAGVV